MTEVLSPEQVDFLETYLGVRLPTGPVETAREPTRTIPVFIRGLGSGALSVELPLQGDLMGALTAAAAGKGFDAVEMDLYFSYGGKPVRPGLSAADIGLQPNATIDAQGRLRGGNGNPLTTPPDIPAGTTFSDFQLLFQAHLSQIKGFKNFDLLTSLSEAFRKLTKYASTFDVSAPIPGATQKDKIGKISARLLEAQNAGYINKSDATLLQWMLGQKKMSKGESGIGMKMADDGSISGRPPFAIFTKDHFEEVQVINNIDTNLRHVVAWHTIRDAYNDLCKSLGNKAQVFQELGKLWTQKEGAIPAKLKQQLDGKILQLIDDKVLSGPADPACHAYRVLYAVNSNPENLWKGDGPANQILPQIKTNTQKQVESLVAGRDELSLVDVYAIADDLKVLASQKGDKVYCTALVEVAMSLERTLAEYEATLDKGFDPAAKVEGLAGAVFYACDKASLWAEIDIVPTDGMDGAHEKAPEVMQTDQKKQKPSVHYASEFLLRDNLSAPDILLLFESLLSFDELV